MLALRERLSCDCGALSGAAPVVAHGDVHVDVSVRSLEAEHERFGVFAGLDALLFGVQLRRRDLEAEAEIIERGDSIADHQVREFEDGLCDDALRFLYRTSGKSRGDLGRGRRFNVEDDSPFDVAQDGDDGSNTFATISLFLHVDVGDLGRRLQCLCEHGVSSVDERLDQLHLHLESPAAVAEAAAGATISSPITYLMTS